MYQSLPRRCSVCKSEKYKLSSDGKCILHSSKSEKSIVLFEAALKKHLRHSNAHFAKIVFPAAISFNRNKDIFFPEGARFDNVAFHSCIFSDLEFKEVRFNETSFKYVRFVNCKFLSSTWRGSSIAHSRFSKCTFIETNFNGAELTHVEFFEPTVENVSFDFAKLDTVSFSLNTLTQSDAMTFFQSEMKGRMSFVGRVETKGAGFDLQSESYTVDFMNVDTSDLNHLEFTTVDMRRWLLRKTDLSEAKFSDITWPKVGRRIAVFDEVDFRAQLKEYRSKAIAAAMRVVSLGWITSIICWNSTLLRKDVEIIRECKRRMKAIEWPFVETLYRRLKLNAENRKEFAAAGDFYIGEKEIQRRYWKTPVGQRIVLNLYWVISKYGESTLRPLLWILVLWFFSGIVYYNCDFDESSIPKYELKDGKVPADYPGLFTALGFSARIIFLLRPNERVVDDFGQIVFFTESILGPVLIGLFGLAMRQKIRR